MKSSIYDPTTEGLPSIGLSIILSSLLKAAKITDLLLNPPAHAIFGLIESPFPVHEALSIVMWLWFQNDQFFRPERTDCTGLERRVSYGRLSTHLSVNVQTVEGQIGIGGKTRLNVK